MNPLTREELRIKTEQELLKWLEDNKLDLDVDQKHALLYGTVPAIMSLVETYSNTDNQLQVWAAKVDQEYTRHEVDNWIFAFGHYARNRLLEIESTPKPPTNGSLNHGEK